MSIADYIWYDRYRPRSLDELVLEPAVKETFAKFIEDGSIPHLLLHGVQGSGKTSIALILMESIKSKNLILNASSKDRGVDTIKTVVSDFARSKTNNDTIKIVLLDEADGLTSEAQDALRGTIDKYSNSCRFIITANNLWKLIPALRSRGMQFNFSAFPVNLMTKRVIHVLKQEGVEYDRKDVSTLVHRLYPDFRSIMNTAQAASMTGVFKVSDFVSGGVSKPDFDSHLLNGGLRTIREQLKGLADFTFLYKHLFDVFIIEHVEENARPEVAQVIAAHLYQDGFVVDKEINFCSCLVSIMLAMGIKNIKF